jgi:thiol peroxidase
VYDYSCAGFCIFENAHEYPCNFITFAANQYKIIMIQEMKENKGVVAFGDMPVTLLGEMIKAGDYAPDFTVTDKGLNPVSLSDFRGKIVILSIFPSIDTKVCAAQTRRFNKEASGLSTDVVILAISKDLPFALNRFCAAEGIERVHTLSDYKHSDFGCKYGFLIKENMLLARGVVVIDRNGYVEYVEYVKNVALEPDYNRALEVVGNTL